MLRDAFLSIASLFKKAEVNAVVSQSSNVNINTDKKESKLKKWVAAVLQNIVSNLLWYLLTAFAAALITYLLAKS